MTRIATNALLWGIAFNWLCAVLFGHQCHPAPASA